MPRETYSNPQKYIDVSSANIKCFIVSCFSFTRVGAVIIMRALFVGGIAQLGERLHGMQEVSGSIPLTSTKSLRPHRLEA